MEKIFKIINELEHEGTIENYALGGATAIIFYAQPRNTVDMDIFIFLKDTSGLIDLVPLSQALQKKGYSWKGEHIIIGGVPVQFLLPPTPLVEEAVKEAVIKDYRGVMVKVMRLEHLLAIMLETNRSKDRERLAGLLEEKKEEIDQSKLNAILTKYQLNKKWERFIDQPK